MESLKRTPAASSPVRKQPRRSTSVCIVWHVVTESMAGSGEISELGASVVDWGTESPFLETSKTVDGTLVLVAVVVGIILVVVMLFALALLIDCRNQRTVVDDRGGDSIARSAVPMAKRVHIPSIFRPKVVRDDNIAFVNKICEENTRPEQIC